MTPQSILFKNVIRSLCRRANEADQPILPCSSALAPSVTVEQNDVKFNLRLGIVICIWGTFDPVILRLWGKTNLNLGSERKPVKHEWCNLDVVA